MFELAEIKRNNGSTIHYTDDGEGIPLVFLHGWMMSRHVWTLQAPLADEFRIVTHDLPGHGDAGASEFSYEACIEDIILLFDRLGLDRAIIVGWSMGSQIAMKVFSRIRARVAGMVLVGGTPHFCSSRDFPHGVPSSEARIMAMRIRKDYHRTAGEFFRIMFSRDETGHIDIAALARKVSGKLPSQGNALSALSELINADLRSELSTISVPVMLVHGIQDEICPYGASEFMAANILSATIELISSAGHAPFLTDPESFNVILARFVKAVHGKN